MDSGLGLHHERLVNCAVRNFTAYPFTYQAFNMLPELDCQQYIVEGPVIASLGRPWKIKVLSQSAKLVIRGILDQAAGQFQRA